MDEEIKDPLAFLLNHGFPLDVIERHRRDGLDYEQQARAAADILARGVQLNDVIDEETGALQSADSESPSKVFEPFDPFEPSDTAKLPSFPVDCLPPILRHMATAAANSLQVSVDMAAVSALAVTSLCVQGKFVICPKAGWTEPLNIYAAIIARPSDRKTPTLDLMAKPLYTFEKEENERRAPLVEAYKMKRDILSKQIANVKDQAAKGKAIDFDEITELQYQLSDLDREQVKPLRLLADDITQEALVSIMSANDGRMGVVSDEGGVFGILEGRYSSGRANLDIFLKAYNGSYLRVDRQGRHGEGIDNPSLTMLLMLQPTVLENIMGNSDFSGRGLLARILFCLPESTVGHRTYETPPMPEGLESTYSLFLKSLLSIPDTGEPRVITITPEAHTEAKRFFESLEPRLIDDLSEENVETWSGKLHGKIMRIAGIIHCCLYSAEAAKTPVSLEEMQAAETIGEYFLAHAKAAFEIAGISEHRDVKDAKYILRRLDGQAKISKRDLFQRCKGKYAKVEDMEPGLAELVRRGYIMIDYIRKDRGRPTEIVTVNPEAQNLKILKNPSTSCF